MAYLSQFTKAKLKKGAPLKPTGNPSSVKVYGPGVQSEGLNVGMSSAMFTINIDGAGPGKLVILCTGPSGPVEVTASSGGANTYVYSYVPAAEGLYRVEVYFSRVAVPGSPFSVNVAPAVNNATTMPLTSVLGPALMASRAVEMAIDQVQEPLTPDGETKAAILLGDDDDYNDEDGDESSDTLSQTSMTTFPLIYLEAPSSVHDVEAWVEAPNGKSLLCAVDKQGKGYRMSFIPHTTGTYYAHIRVPIDITEPPVSSSDEAAETIQVNLGKTIEWKVSETRNMKGKLKVRIVGPKNVNVKMTKNADNTHTVFLNPSTAGTYIVHVTRGDKAVHGSPFTVKVCNPKHVKLNGPGITSQQVGFAELLEWNVDLKKSGFIVTDLKAIITGSDDNQKELDIIQKDPTKVTIQMSPSKHGPYKLQVTAGGEAVPQSPVTFTLFQPDIPELPKIGDERTPHEDEVHMPQLLIDTAGEEEEDSLAYWVKEPNGNAVSCSIQKEGRTSKLQFIPREPGIHYAFITKGEKPIIGSPFPITVTKQQCDIVQEYKQFSLQDNTIEMVIKEQLQEKSRLNYKIQGPGKCTAKFHQNIDKTYNIVLTPSCPGTYLVYVTDGNRPVQGSPFVFKVVSPKEARVSGPAVRKLVGSAFDQLMPVRGLKTISSFTATDKLQWTLDLTNTGLFTSDVKAVVVGEKEYRKELEIVQKDPMHGTISFVAPTSGKYTIRVLLAGQEIPQSPVEFSIVERHQPSIDTHEISQEDQIHFKPIIPSETVVIEQPEFYIDIPGVEEGTLEVYAKAPNGSVVNSSVDKEGNRYKVSFIPQVAGTYYVNVSVDDKPINGSPFPIDVTEQQVVKTDESQTPVIDIAQPLQWTIKEPLSGTGELKVNIQGPKKCTAMFKQNPDKTTTIVFTPTFTGTYLVYITDQDQPVRGTPFLFKVVDQKQARVSGPAVSKLVGSAFDQLLPVVGLKTISSFTTTDKLQWTLDLTNTGLFTTDVKAFVLGEKEYRKELEIVQKDPMHGTISFVAPTSGKYTIHMLLAKHEIPLSPVEFKMVDKGELSIDVADETDSGNFKPLIPSEKVITEQPELFIDATGVEEDTLEVYVKAPNGRVVNSSVDKEGNRYKVSFVPQVAGTHYVNVSVDDKPINGSPFPIDVTEKQVVVMDESQTPVIDIAQPLHWTTGEPMSGTGELKVNIQGPKKCTAMFKQNPDKTTTIVFTPTFTGTYLVYISDQDQPVRGTPFLFKVVDQKQARVSGPAVRELVGSAFHQLMPVGGLKSINSFTTTDKLQWSLDLTNTGLFTSDVKAFVVGEKEYRKELEIVQKDPMHGAISFVAPTSGKYSVQVLLAGQEIPQSPVEFSIVEENQPSIDTHEISQEDQIRLKPIIPSETVVIEQPEFCIDISGMEEDTLQVNFKPLIPSEKVIIEQPELFIDATGVEEDTLEVYVKAPNGRVVNSSVDKEGNRYKVSFVPHVAGTHYVNVSVDDKPIKNSPFPIDVTEKQVVVMDETQTPVIDIGLPLQWTIKEPLSGTGELKVNIQGPKKCTAMFKQNPDKTTTIVFTPTFAGTYLVYITDRDQAVQGSPFVFKAVSPQDVRISGPGISMEGGGFVVSKLMQWTVNLGTSCLFVSDIKAFISGASGDLSEIEINETHPLCGTIVYSAPRPGKYNLRVTAAGREIIHSPVNISFYDPSRISVVGPNFKTGYVGQSVRVKIDVTGAGEGSLSLKLDGPANVVPLCTSEEQGLFLLSFEPPVAGTYNLHVMFYDQPIPGSPFSIIVSEQTPVETISVSGAGIQGGELSGKVGFIVKLAAGFDEKLLTVNAIGPNAVCDVTRSSDNHGSLLFEYTPTLAGPYNFDVIYDGKHVTGSPFEAIWLRPPPDASKCHVVGIEKHGKFMVDCRNGGGNGFLEIAVFGAYYPAENINVQHNGDYTFDITYKIFRPGKTTISVKWHNVHLVGSPFTVDTIA